MWSCPTNHKQQQIRASTAADTDWSSVNVSLTETKVVIEFRKKFDILKIMFKGVMHLVLNHMYITIVLNIVLFI